MEGSVGENEGGMPELGDVPEDGRAEVRVIVMVEERGDGLSGGEGDMRRKGTAAG